MCCQVSHSFADLIGTGLPGGSYRDRHRPPQAVDRKDQHRAANDRDRRVVVVATRSGEGPFTHRLQTSILARRPRASWMEARITKLAEVLRRTCFKSRSRSPAAPTRTLAVSSLQLCAYRQSSRTKSP